jgi:hypothetical protein
MATQDTAVSPGLAKAPGNLVQMLTRVPAGQTTHQQVALHQQSAGNVFYPLAQRNDFQTGFSDARPDASQLFGLCGNLGTVDVNSVDALRQEVCRLVKIGIDNCEPPDL